jgi:hypothetical protein
MLGSWNTQGKIDQTILYIKLFVKLSSAKTPILGERATFVARKTYTAAMG